MLPASATRRNQARRSAEGARGGAGAADQPRQQHRRREQQHDRDEMRREPQIANQPRIDPRQRSMTRELDESVLRRDRDGEADRRSRVAAGQRLDCGFVTPADFVGRPSRRPHVDVQRRRTANRCLECDQVVFAGDDLRDDAGAFDVEALRRRGARGGAGALRQIQAISGDVGPVTDDQQTDADGDQHQNQRKFLNEPREWR